MNWFPRVTDKSLEFPGNSPRFVWELSTLSNRCQAASKAERETETRDLGHSGGATFMAVTPACQVQLDLTKSLQYKSSHTSHQRRKSRMKCDVTFQTADTLKTARFVLDLVYGSGMNQIFFCVCGEKIGIMPLRLQ